MGSSSANGTKLKGKRVNKVEKSGEKVLTYLIWDRREWWSGTRLD